LYTPDKGYNQNSQIFTTALSAYLILRYSPLKIPKGFSQQPYRLLRSYWRAYGGWRFLVAVMAGLVFAFAIKTLPLPRSAV
jgi:hypothetical protein